MLSRMWNFFFLFRTDYFKLFKMVDNKYLKKKKSAAVWKIHSFKLGQM